jgi:hypothetical protein
MGPGIYGNPRTMRYSNAGGGLSLEPPVFNIAEKLEYRNGVKGGPIWSLRLPWKRTRKRSQLVLHSQRH